MSVNGTKASAVVFDMDGLMFDTERLYFAAESEYFAARGLEFTPEIAQKIMGVPAVPAMEILIAEYGIDDSPQDMLIGIQALLMDRLKNDLNTMPGFWELLEVLEAKTIRKAVATSAGREIMNMMIGSFDLFPRFEFVLTGDDVTHGKPHPEIYEKACDRLGLDPPEVLVLEDSLNGALSAKAAGCRCVAVPHHLSSSHDFSFVDHVAEGLSDANIVALLDGDH